MESNVIDIKNVAVYQGPNLVLSNVNITVKKGEFVYLIGKTGSGKSSLLKMLYAEIPLKEGSINIANTELKGIKEKDIPFVRRKLGIVFQPAMCERSLRFSLCPWTKSRAAPPPLPPPSSMSRKRPSALPSEGALIAFVSETTTASNLPKCLKKRSVGSVCKSYSLCFSPPLLSSKITARRQQPTACPNLGPTCRRAAPFRQKRRTRRGPGASRRSTRSRPTPSPRPRTRSQARRRRTRRRTRPGQKKTGRGGERAGRGPR